MRPFAAIKRSKTNTNTHVAGSPVMNTEITVAYGLAVPEKQLIMDWHLYNDGLTFESEIAYKTDHFSDDHDALVYVERTSHHILCHYNCDGSGGLSNTVDLPWLAEKIQPTPAEKAALLRVAKMLPGFPWPNALGEPRCTEEHPGSTVVYFRNTHKNHR